MPVGLVVGDISTFRKYVKNIGRAYQKRSVAMIQLCRLFLEISSGKPDQTDALKSLLEIVENALKSAVEAGKGRSDDADEAFATAEEQLDQYAVRYHAREQDVLGDVHDIIEDAAQKDSQIMKTYNRLSARLGLSRLHTPRSSSLVKVRFQILHSPTDRHSAPIVTCELGPEVNVSELLWTFSRLPEDQRVTLKQNPHFYLSRDLSDRPLTYDDNFVLQPIKDLKPEKDLVVLILSDRNGQIYFDYEKFSKTYGNIWKPHNTIILKDLQGTLEAANRISPKINGEVCIWQRGGGLPDGDLTEWTEVLDQALSAPDADWLIRSETSCDEAFDIEVTGGWERCSPIKEPEPAPVFGLGNSVTPTPSHEDALTPLEDSGSGSSVPTLDSSGQSSYYSRDDTGFSDATSVEEAQLNAEEYSPPVKDAASSEPDVSFALDSAIEVEMNVPSFLPVKDEVFSGPEDAFPFDEDVQVETVVPSSPPVEDSSGQELSFPLDGGVQVETAVPSSPPVQTEVSSSPEVSFPLDGGVQVETAVPSPVLTPHVLPELLDSHIGSEPDAASSIVPDRIITPKKTHLLVEAVHIPPQPTSPPKPPTPPDISNDEAAATDGWSTPDSTTPLSEISHTPLQLAHPPAQALPSPTPPTHVSDAPTPNILTPLEHPRRQVEPVHPPAQPVLSPYLPLTRPTESTPAPRSDVADAHRLTPALKPAPQQVETVRPPESNVATSHKLTPAPKPAPQQAEAVKPPESDVAATYRLTSASKPVPQQVEAVRPPESDVAASHKLTSASRPTPQQVEAVRPPESDVAASHKLTLVSKPAPRQVEVVRPPESDAAASHKLTPDSKPTAQRVAAVRPPVQPMQAHGPQVPASPMAKPAPSSSATVPSALEHIPPRIEPVHSLNLGARTHEAPTPPFRSNAAISSDAPTLNRVAVVSESVRPPVAMVHRPVQPVPAPRIEHSPNLPARTPQAFTPPFRGNPAPNGVAAVSESARPPVEMISRPVQLVPAPRPPTSSGGSKPAPTGSASVPSKTIPAPDHTRSLTGEAVRLPTQYTATKSSPPVGTASATLTPGGIRSPAAAVPRPVQVVHTPGSSALPVRSGPVPAGSVPAPNMIRPPSERPRPQAGAGRPPTVVSRAPPASRVAPIGNTPAASASGPDTKEVSRHRIKSHPRKMVTPVGQRRSVVAPMSMVAQPAAPPPGQPKSTPVPQTTTRLAPKNSNSLPLHGMSTGMSSASSPPEPKVRMISTPTPGPAVPTAPSSAPPATLPRAAPSTRAGNVTSVPSPIVSESGPRISDTDYPMGRSRQPTVVQEQMPPRPTVRPVALPLMHPEQPATSSSPNRSSATSVPRQDRVSAVLLDSSHQKRASRVSIPGGWAESNADSKEVTSVTTPPPASKAATGNATILPTPAASNVSPTPTSKPKDPIREPRPPTALPEPTAPQVTVRLSALVTLPKQQVEPTTSPDSVVITRRGETTKPSSYGSRMETAGVLSGVETLQGEPKPRSTPTTALPIQQAGVVNVVPEPVLRRSGQRITSRIKTKDLINRHKPQVASDVRPPSMARSPSKSPMLDTSQPTPTKLDPNRIDSGIELWDYRESLGARGDRQKGFNIPANRDNKGPADRAAASMLPMKLPAVLERADGKEGRHLPLPYQESSASTSKSPEPPASIRPLSSYLPETVQAPPPNTTESSHAESPASTPPGRGGGAFLTRKPQASFQSAIQGSYLENSTPPRSSTPSSMTHATTAATSTHATLVTPASSFPQLSSSFSSKAQPRSWFRRNVIDPFKTKLGLAPA